MFLKRNAFLVGSLVGVVLLTIVLAQLEPKPVVYLYSDLGLSLLLLLGIVFVSWLVFTWQVKRPLQRKLQQLQDAGEHEREAWEQERKDYLWDLRHNILSRYIEKGISTELGDLKWNLNQYVPPHPPSPIHQNVDYLFLLTKDLQSAIENLTCWENAVQGTPNMGQRIRVNSLLRKAAENVAREFPPGDWPSVKLNLTQVNPLVQGNEPLLEKAFYNLIHNAHKFGKKEEINVISSIIEKEVVISIIDQGIGIPSDSQHRLFTPLGRMGNVDDETPGTGLGLFTTKAIIERHNGHLDFVSKEHVETTFTVFLPLGDIHASDSIHK